MSELVETRDPRWERVRAWVGASTMPWREDRPETEFRIWIRIEDQKFGMRLGVPDHELAADAGLYSKTLTEMVRKADKALAANGYNAGWRP